MILAEPDGTERHRLVGYLPAEDFLAQIELGLAKGAFGRQQFEQARTAFQAVAEKYPRTDDPWV